MRMIPLVFLLFVVMLSLGYASAYSYNDTLLNDNGLIITSDKQNYICGITECKVYIEVENTTGSNISDIDFGIYFEKRYAADITISEIHEWNTWDELAPVKVENNCLDIIEKGTIDLNSEYPVYICNDKDEEGRVCQSDKLCRWWTIEDQLVSKTGWKKITPSPSLSAIDLGISSAFDISKSYSNISVSALSGKRFFLTIKKPKEARGGEFLVTAVSRNTPSISSVLDPWFDSDYPYKRRYDFNNLNTVTAIYNATLDFNLTDTESHANDSCLGITVTDFAEATELDFNLVEANAGWCHLRIDLNAAVDSNKSFYVYYGHIGTPDNSVPIDLNWAARPAQPWSRLDGNITDQENISTTFWFANNIKPNARFAIRGIQWYLNDDGDAIGSSEIYDTDDGRIPTTEMSSSTKPVAFDSGTKWYSWVFDTNIFTTTDKNIFVGIKGLTANSALLQREVQLGGLTNPPPAHCSSNYNDGWNAQSCNYIYIYQLYRDIEGEVTMSAEEAFATPDIDAQITATPAAPYIIDPDGGTASISIDFNDTSAYSSTVFGDANWFINSNFRGNDQNMLAVDFNAAGDYNITIVLNADDGGAGVIDQQDLNVHIDIRPQGLDINFSDNSPLVNTAVDINSWFDQPPTITNVAWIVPDPDTNYTDFNATHTFNSAGTKSVCFIATNDADLNTLYCENITVSGIYSMTFREEDSANNFPTLSVAGDGLAVTIDGNNFSGDISVDGVLNLSKQSLPTGRYTMLASATGMTERTFMLDLNAELDLDLNILLLSDTNASTSAFTFFKPDDSTKFADANVTLHYWKLPTYWSGRITLDGIGGGSFFMNGADTNYAFDIEDGDTNYLYVGTDVNVLPPKRADNGLDINANFTIAVSGGIASSNHNDLNKATIIHIYSDTNSPYSFTIDSNSDFIETTLLVNPTGGDTNLTIQPYLSPVSDVLGTTFRAVRKSDQTSIPDVTIIIYQSIGGTDEIVASGTTDVKGEFLAFLVVNQSYKLTVIDVNGSTSLDKEPYTQTSTTLVFIYLGSLGMEVITVPGSISVLFTPGFETFTDGNTTFTQKFTSDKDFNTMDVNYFRIIVQTTNAGVDANVYDVNLQKYTGWSGTATTLTHSFDFFDDFTLFDNNRFTVRTFIYYNDGTVAIRAKSYFYRTTTSWMDIARGQFRVELGCPADGSACPATIIFSILLAAVFTAMAIMGIGPLRNSRSAGVIFMALIAFFTYLNWMPLILTAIMVIAVLFISSMTRGEPG